MKTRILRDFQIFISVPLKKPILQVMRSTIGPKLQLKILTMLLDVIITSLEDDSVKLFQWFSNIQMKANRDKQHLLVSGKNRVV